MGRPGQFVNIALEGLYLRRPISVCDVEEGYLRLIFKAVGKGTEKLAAAPAGAKFDVLTGLGNGYDVSLAGDAPLLIGGGAGLPPMYLLCKTLLAQGKKVSVAAGFNSADEIFLCEELSALGADVYVCTADGSVGIKGFVTGAMEKLSGAYTHVFTCGPEPMLKAVWKACETDGQFSFEERMGCGFGACMGCTCETITGYKRICREGPVLGKGEIKW
ncbi:MAG: dihydroorotate dehydrogenase electron transfer subunit [Clostridia bacterium]|nr:dihydroorotate dehydrogenase electron transfer subunit [Clostridia bacterium]